MSTKRVSRGIPREQARSEAENELIERGCILNADGLWEFSINLDAYGKMPAKAALPARFPDELPEIFIERPKLIRRIPHVERTGKICLAPNTGILLDATAPRQLIRDALNRAQRILIDGLSGKNSDDLIEEFSAYWNSGVSSSIVSLCDASAESRIVSLMEMIVPGEPKRTITLAADDREQAERWSARAGWRINKRDTAFLVKIETAFEPPDFEDSISTSDLVELILESAVPEASESMQRWLRSKSLPAYILLAIPLVKDQGFVIIAASMEEAVGDAKKRAQRGFRPNHLPASIETRFTKKSPVSRIEVKRLDADYLLPRGGATKNLLARTVAIVGCGAIGSNVAKDLASLGIGRIRIVDPEALTAENIHRHVLGVSFLDQKKVEGMRLSLNKHFPHICVEDKPDDIRTVLDIHPEFVTSADLVIFALGDETLELYLNDLLGQRMPRIHVWVEPLGIGGHVLGTGLSSQGGCFRCLFDTDDLLGIHNQSAFAAPGQSFQPAFAGCAGTFTPFGGLDAERTANEAARLASRILLKRQTSNLLISWRGDDDDFSDAGFQLSARGKMLRPGDRRIETSFARADCLSCGPSS
jgi:molybdopterin-synthase adenylyltransferase